MSNDPIKIPSTNTDPSDSLGVIFNESRRSEKTEQDSEKTPVSQKINSSFSPTKKSVKSFEEEPLSPKIFNPHLPNGGRAQKDLLNGVMILLLNYQVATLPLKQLFLPQRPEPTQSRKQQYMRPKHQRMTIHMCEKKF
jgi:hypothetical protein